MTDLSAALLDYAEPPVVEVVFAVGVEPLPVSVIDLSEFAISAFGDEFPDRQEQPPVHMVRERFDSPLPGMGPALALLAGQPSIRLWLRTADSTRLIQLQRDWLACNWQKAAGPRPYPRYEAIEQFFLDTWTKAEGLAQGRGRALLAQQCELSYVNQILPGATWDRHGQMARVIRLAADARAPLPEAEDGQLAFRYRMEHEGRPVGRLYVTAAPGFRPVDMTPTIQLTLSARGVPLSADRAGMIGFFRLAHRWIVHGFAAVTTDEAQDTLWGRLR